MQPPTTARLTMLHLSLSALLLIRASPLPLVSRDSSVAAIGTSVEGDSPSWSYGDLSHSSDPHIQAMAVLAAPDHVEGTDTVPSVAGKMVDDVPGVPVQHGSIDVDVRVAPLSTPHSLQPSLSEMYGPESAQGAGAGSRRIAVHRAIVAEYNSRDAANTMAAIQLNRDVSTQKGIGDDADEPSPDIPEGEGGVGWWQRFKERVGVKTIATLLFIGYLSGKILPLFLCYKLWRRRRNARYARLRQEGQEEPDLAGEVEGAEAGAGDGPNQERAQQLGYDEVGMTPDLGVGADEAVSKKAAAGRYQAVQWQGREVAVVTDERAPLLGSASAGGRPVHGNGRARDG